jgi:hypothetical protein
LTGKAGLALKRAAIMDEHMEAVSAERPYASTTARVLRGLRPTAPAAFGAFAVAFVAALLMPMAWLSAICWNLYLDTIHPIFMEPLGNAARIGVGLGMGVIAVLAAAAVVLALATPAAQTWLARFRGAKNADDFSEYADTAEAPPSFARRRSADVHPDAPPVAPINALRDLPAAGLGPVPLDVTVVEPAEIETLDLVEYAADPATHEPEAIADAAADPVQPDRADTSLGAMVARLEAGLVRQRDSTDSGPDDTAPAVDLALEAALSTLHRMNKRAVG